MVKTKILATFCFLILGIACQKENEGKFFAEDNSSDVSVDKANNSNSKALGDIQFANCTGQVALFFDEPNLEVYFIQLNDGASILAPVSPTGITLDKINNELTVNLSTGSDIVYDFDNEDIIGLGWISYGEALNKGILAEDSSGIYELDPDCSNDDILSKCKCFEPKTGLAGLFEDFLPNNCDAGGESAASCSVGSSGTDPGCSVSCKEYATPCCTADDSFTFD